MLPLTTGTATPCRVHSTSRAAVYCRKSCLLTQCDLQKLWPDLCLVAPWKRRWGPGAIGHGSAAQCLNRLSDLQRRSSGRQWRRKGHGDRVRQLFGTFPEETTALETKNTPPESVQMHGDDRHLQALNNPLKPSFEGE